MNQKLRISERFSFQTTIYSELMGKVCTIWKSAEDPPPQKQLLSINQAC